MMASGRNFDRISTPFSDAVIGSVLTRSVAPKCYVAESSCNTSAGSSHQHQIHYIPSSTTMLPPLRKFSPPSAVESTERFLPRTRQNTTASAQNFALDPHLQGRVSAPYPQTSVTLATNLPARTVSTASATMSINVMPKHQRKCWVSAKSEACREQCRTNQARYRQKQREYVSKLESTAAQLREEIPMLEVQRRRLRYDSRQRVWDVVVEYFQLFRHGVGGDAFEIGSAHTNDILRASEAQQQLMFLRSTMAPDVKFGNVRGVEVLMKHWRRMSEYHESLKFQLTHMEKVSDSIVTATAILSVTITKTTLEFIFPHLMGSENVEDLSLAVKLLGHKLDYPCSVLFFWDEKTSLVAQVETDIDMALPFAKLLGNIKDASRVVEGAVMAPNLPPQLYRRG